MSEKARRAATHSKGANRTDPSDDETFPNRLKKAANDFAILLQDAGGLGHLDNLINERRSLQDKVERNESEMEDLRAEALKMQQGHSEEIAKLGEEISGMKSALDLVVGEFGARYKQWDEDKERYITESKELSALRSQLDRAKAKIESLSSENHELRDENKRLDGKIREGEASNKLLRSKLDRRNLKLNETGDELKHCRDLLTQLQDNLGIIPPDQNQV